MVAEHRRDRLPLFVMMAAGGTSAIGNMLTNVAIPWFVLQTTGSASRTGIAAAAAVLPVVIAGVFGGTFVDRIGYKRASVISDLASGVTVATIPLLHLTVGLAFWQLLALVFLGALLDAPGMTGRQSLIPELSRRAGVGLEGANSAHGAIQRAATMAGPILAGVLIAMMGASNVLWVNAATFAVSAGAIGLAVPSPERVRRLVRPATGYFTELAEGFLFVQRDRLIVTLLVVVTITNLLTAPLFAVILPVYASTVFGSAVNLGVMLGGFGGGALVGAVLYGAVGHRLPRRMTFMIAFLLSSASLGGLAFLPGVALATVILVLCGLLAGPVSPLLMTLLQERTPDGMRGRVFGMVMATAWIAMPLGMLLSGLALEYFGVRATIIAITAGSVAASLTLFVNPALREMDERVLSAED
ncbi:MAG TPA: MFS transporter [Thermomicrobiales bacterium]|nr:MFS transporter [Thermomicrobiales bacterium]